MHLSMSIALALVLVGSAPAVGQEIYVHNVLGDDAANGDSDQPGPLGGPLRTIACALERVHKGGRIVLVNSGQPYREMISLSDVEQRGYARQPLVIDGGGAVLDGTVESADGAWTHFRGNVFSMRPRRLAYQQLFAAARPLRRNPVASWSPDVPDLAPLEWALVGGRIYFCVEQDRLPRDYPLRHAGLQTGVTLYNTEHVRIENLIVQGFQQDGINAHDTVYNCAIVNVECRANGRSGISVGGTSRVEIAESASYDNGRAQLRLEGLAKVTMQDCELDGATAPAVDMRGGELIVDGRPFIQ